MDSDRHSLAARPGGANSVPRYSTSNRLSATGKVSYPVPRYSTSNRQSVTGKVSYPVPRYSTSNRLSVTGKVSYPVPRYSTSNSLSVTGKVSYPSASVSPCQLSLHYEVFCFRTEICAHFSAPMQIQAPSVSSYREADSLLLTVQTDVPFQAGTGIQ